MNLDDIKVNAQQLETINRLFDLTPEEDHLKEAIFPTDSIYTRIPIQDMDGHYMTLVHLSQIKYAVMTVEGSGPNSGSLMAPLIELKDDEIKFIVRHIGRVIDLNSAED